jgi:hypothetical protein
MMIIISNHCRAKVLNTPALFVITRRIIQRKLISQKNPAVGDMLPSLPGLINQTWMRFAAKALV